MARLPPPIYAQEATADCGAGNPLHGRTQKVVGVILDALSTSDCSAVTSAQLAGITALNLNSKNLSSLRSGDFDGLSGLETLRLDNNFLAALPGDVFEGLSNLQDLRLDTNVNLAVLPPDVFDGLSNLRVLRLYNNNSLTALPPDVFDGLSNLQDLRLYNTPLATLPPDVFEGLSNLRDLRLDRTPLSCVHPGQFDGLSELRTLNLSSTNLGNITPSLPDLFPWELDKLEELRLGDTRPNQIGLDLYKAVLPALSDIFLRNVAELSAPVCGFITADMDGAYHGTVRVSLDGMSVRPNRARASDAALLGDGVCGSDPAMPQHVLWTWQRSADGVTWTDTPNQPKAYGVRAEGECSFTYTPQSDDAGMYIRAYVPVNTAGIGRHDYHTAAFGPLTLRP